MTSIIGIDIGGTSIKIGNVDTDGRILNKWEIATSHMNDGASIISDIWQSLSQNISDITAVKGIGIGAPGFIDSTTGYVYEAVNIGWKDLALAEELRALSGLPVFVANDANVAALGENWKGAGDNAQNLIALTIGTGVGGGLIVDGDIVDGANGMAGEIGHATIEPGGYLCNCGRRGCLETVASATGIVRQAMETIKTGANNQLIRHYQAKGAITAKDIFDLADQGDAASREIIMHTADTLGMAIANAAAFMNPEKVLIGGGVSKAGNHFIDLIDAAFRNYALQRVSVICDLKAAQLENDAGMIGAAGLVKQKLDL
ncbi:glucokinase [Barrientosiimonas marina]|uniref:Glucokinase n=1 Tax=Lentibacillus kimchii TaxID=1542911 RepID=A0ABW2UXX2_9BACI